MAALKIRVTSFFSNFATQVLFTPVNTSIQDILQILFAIFEEQFPCLIRRIRLLRKRSLLLCYYGIHEAFIWI